MKKAVFVVFLMALFAMPLLADVTAPTSSSRQIVEKSGLALQLKQMPAMIEQQIVMLEQQNGPMPAERKKNFFAALKKSFQPEVLTTRLAAAVEKSLSLEERQAILQFLDSPLGRKVIAAENTMISPEAMAKLEKEAPQKMEKLMKNNTRLALLQSLDQATRATDIATEISLNTALATEWGLINQSDMPEKPSFDEVRKAYEQNRLMIRMQTAQAVLAGMAMTYEGLTDEELTDYLTFANSATGKAYFHKIGNALGEVLVEAAASFGEALANDDKGPV